MRSDKQFFKSLDGPQLTLVHRGLELLVDEEIQKKDASVTELQGIYFLIRQAKKEMHGKITAAHNGELL
jgi:hypothetical protein